MLLLLWVRVNRWYSTGECWVSWVETVKCAGQQHETWKERGPGSACLAPTPKRFPPLTLSYCTGQFPGSYLKLYLNWMLIPTWCSYLLVLLVWEKDQITKQECDWGFEATIAKQQRHLGVLHPCNSSSADHMSSVKHSQSHSCWCKPLMNRQHACCQTCITKAGDWEGTTHCSWGVNLEELTASYGGSWTH